MNAFIVRLVFGLAAFLGINFYVSSDTGTYSETEVRLIDAQYGTKGRILGFFGSGTPVDLPDPLPRRNYAAQPLLLSEREDLAADLSVALPRGTDGWRLRAFRKGDALAVRPDLRPCLVIELGMCADILTADPPLILTKGKQAIAVQINHVPKRRETRSLNSALRDVSLDGFHHLFAVAHYGHDAWKPAETLRGLKFERLTLKTYPGSAHMLRTTLTGDGPYEIRVNVASNTDEQTTRAQLAGLDIALLRAMVAPKCSQRSRPCRSPGAIPVPGR